MMRLIAVLLLSLCTLCGAASAQPTDKKAAKELKAQQKAKEKAHKKEIREEIRYYESLRNDAVLKFANANQPKDIRTPFGDSFRVSKVVCAGDYTTGTVVLHLDVTPIYGGIRLYMGGNRNGTEAIADGERYSSVDLYGRVYTLRTSQPQEVIVMFRDVPTNTKQLDRVDISMGLALTTLNFITLRDVPIFWTYSDKFIGNYVRSNDTNKP